MGRLTRRIALWGGAAAVASGGFAFMASNSVAASKAGTGAGVVSGYNVSTVHYALVTQPDVPGGSYIQQVSFTLTSAATAGNVKAWFTGSPIGATTTNTNDFVSGFYSCTTTTGSGFKWNCQNPNVINGFQWAATGAASLLHVSAGQ